jgi:hypothetical protein
LHAIIANSPLLGIAVLQFAKESAPVLLYLLTIALSRDVAIQERIKFAGCKPRIRFSKRIDDCKN